MTCRICNNSTYTVLDLGPTPPANSFISSIEEEIESFPLVLEYCSSCSNLQLRDCLNSEKLYKNYYYVTPKSRTLDSHYNFLTNFLLVNNYLNSESCVVEVGSNIGDFLKHLKPYVRSTIGIDPAENIATEANRLGIETICDFFSTKSADNIKSKYGFADTIIARHCFAHNESPHDLLKGVKLLMAPGGHVVIENAYAVNTIEGNEIDQIYHEHMFYYSIQSMSKALELNGLVLVDVLISVVHGGSISFVAKHAENNPTVSDSVADYLLHEKTVLNEPRLRDFASSAFKIKRELSNLVKKLLNEGNTIYSYGATAKGNTLLNFIGLDNKSISYCVDSTDIKQGKFLPGSKIKIIDEEEGLKNPPDYFLLTAWNYRDEIISKTRKSGNCSSSFIVPFPKLTIMPER